MILIMSHGIFIEKLIFNNYRDTINLTLQSMANHMESYMDSCENFFLQYLFDENLERFFGYVDNHEISPEDKKTFYNYFKRSVKYRNAVIKYMAASNSYLQSVGYVPENNNQDKIFFLKRAVNNVEILDLAQSNYEELVESAKDIPLSKILISKDTLEPDSDDQAFVLLRRINQVERARRQGYLLLEVSSGMYEEVVSNFGLEENAGVVITYPDMREAYASSTQIKSRFQQIGDVGSARERERISIENRKYRLYSIQSESGFYIDYLIPEAAITSKVWRLYGILMMVWIAAVTSAFILYTRLFGKIKKATTEIMDLIENYQLNNDNCELEYSQVSGIVEFDNIGLTLINMMKRIQDFVKEEYILKLKQQAAEYKAMQTEVNPHFLNNVLSSFVALNRIGEKKRLETAILKLSLMFRYTCEHGYDSQIGRECQFIESYLMLEKLRFEERLEYMIFVEKEVEEIEIPKLLLQPIVENAMKHGFIGDNKMTICLRASKVESGGREFIWITVANNGSPFSNAGAEKTSGVGLRNVKERLALVYPNSFFWFCSTEKYATVCNILIVREEGKR